MSEQDYTAAASRSVTGRAARTAATLFNYGNILAIAIPPLGMPWLGVSMLVCAMNRHHPNPKAGRDMQQAAYRCYGSAGFFVVVATFIPVVGLGSREGTSRRLAGHGAGAGE